MKHLLFLVPLLLVSVAALASQSGGSDRATDPDVVGNRDNTVSVRGCLANESGNYTLTNEATGASYRLTGDVSSLEPHVGLDIEVEGELNRPDANQPGSISAQQADNQPTVSVRALTDVTGKCKIAE